MTTIPTHPTTAPRATTLRGRTAFASTRWWWQA
jgi:hypothetical protein